MPASSTSRLLRSARFRVGACLLTGALLGAAGLPVHAAATIKVGGTGSALETVRLLAEEYKKVHPGAQVVIFPNLGSRGGIKAAIAGAIDIGLSGRPLTEAERRAGATAIEYGRTPLVFATTARNAAVTSVSRRDVTTIHSGALARWSDGTHIRVVVRPDGDSDTTLLHAAFPEVRAETEQVRQRNGVLLAITDREAADNLERLPGSFGTLTLAIILAENRAIKPLQLDGVAPTPASIADGSYPLYKRMMLVQGPKANPAAAGFVAFIRSPAARPLLSRIGHWVE